MSNTCIITNHTLPVPLPICPHCNHGNGQHYGDCKYIKEKQNNQTQTKFL